MEEDDPTLNTPPELFVMTVRKKVHTAWFSCSVCYGHAGYTP